MITECPTCEVSYNNETVETCPMCTKFKKSKFKKWGISRQEIKDFRRQTILGIKKKRKQLEGNSLGVKVKSF